MWRRVLGWSGLVIGVAAVVALGVLFASVGLDRADKMASALGVFVGLAGLGVAVFGLISSRRDGARDGSGGVHNTIGGSVSGTAIQARDINMGAPAPPTEERGP